MDGRATAGQKGIRLPTPLMIVLGFLVPAKDRSRPVAGFRRSGLRKSIRAGRFGTERSLSGTGRVLTFAKTCSAKTWPNAAEEPISGTSRGRCGH